MTFKYHQDHIAGDIKFSFGEHPTTKVFSLIVGIFNTKDFVDGLYFFSIEKGNINWDDGKELSLNNLSKRSFLGINIPPEFKHYCDKIYKNKVFM